MAEQSSHDVVNQTRSGGDLSPSDVPASKPDKYISGGDGEGVHTIISTHQRQQEPDAASQDRPDRESMSFSYPFDERNILSQNTVSPQGTFHIETPSRRKDGADSRARMRLR